MNIKQILNKFDDNKEEDIFYVRGSEQKRTTAELIEESKLNQSYYFMLFFSAIITVAGILMDNSVIILAGMLVAPLLKPILAFSLGIVMLNFRLLFRSLLIIFVSSAIVVAVGMTITFIYDPIMEINIRQNKFMFNSLYFIIAIFSGMAASFAWTKKKEMYEALSGAAIAATLLPPLAMIGIMTAKIETAGLQDALFVFLYNLATITGGSGLVFILSGFTGKKDVQKEIDKGLEKEEKEG